MQKSRQLFFIIGALSAGMAVATGAFGAHVLRQHLTPEMLDVFATGSRYQMYHSLALLGISLASAHWYHPLIKTSGWLFIIGIILFSGSLYLLALMDVKWFGFMTPFGGLSFLLGWILLGVGVFRSSESR